MMMVRPLLAKLAMSGTRRGDHHLGGSVTFLKAGGRNDLAVEGERLRAGRDDGFMVECHAQLSGSVAIIGFTGAVKFITNFGGVVLLTWAVK